jgi:uncharacterized membrane-anchored protein
MTDLEKTIWRASRGVPDALSTLLTRLFADMDALTARLGCCEAMNNMLLDRIEALEAKRGPGRPPKG